MISKRHRQIRKKTEKAILDYGMIEKNDRLIIGVSGGPDSLSLLKLFVDGFIEVTVPFSFIAVHIDLGFEQKNPKNCVLLESHFQKLGVDYRIVKTDIQKQALDPNTKKNPCFICSFHRRRKIYEIAHSEGCKKIAYGHHKDDIIETLLINILYGREIGSMNPVQGVFKGSKHIIRPFAYVDEWMLKAFAAESDVPRLERLCPMDGYTRRERVKRLIVELQREEKVANIRENIFKSMYHVNIDFAPPASTN